MNIQRILEVKNHKVTMIPIFFKASTLTLAFLSLNRFEETFMILNGDILSLFLTIKFNISSVRKLLDRFKLVTLPQTEINFSKPLSVILFLHSFKPRIFLCFRTFFTH